MLVAKFKHGVTFRDEVVGEGGGHLEDAPDTVQMEGDSVEHTWRCFYDADFHAVLACVHSTAASFFVRRTRTTRLMLAGITASAQMFYFVHPKLCIERRHVPIL